MAEWENEKIAEIVEQIHTENPDIVQMIEDYITYNNNRRVQRKLGVLTPMEKHHSYSLAA